MSQWCGASRLYAFPSLCRTSPFHSVRGGVWLRDRDAGNAETQVRRRATDSDGPFLGLATCLRVVQVVFVSLDLIDSHLDEQDVDDDAVWSLLRCQLRRGLVHFVAGPPSSTFAPPFRDFTWQPEPHGHEEGESFPGSVVRYWP